MENSPQATSADPVRTRRGESTRQKASLTATVSGRHYWRMYGQPGGARRGEKWWNAA